ncbi:MAG: Asp-tRNA(Asn)/Glu-tRNA(Gln) amidotransferase subunit GatA [Sphingobacteriales bacterium]|nr:Asp-tRNA(Asn)/Glu-tRNA(Gln) amidotransferase subunit GatA [Sphingobacteriales bacterium]OJW02196.1 MAG: glutaminyl-tRNA synthase (glutamine-hydrolyzing) subunit A [Sphingobacteriales bacterium 44-61]
MFEFSSIRQYHASLQEGKTTCLQAVEHYLQRIAATRHLNAFIEVYADEALQKAKELDEKRKTGQATGKLHGIVIGLKDVICYKDHKVSASSNILRDFTSIYSATAVARLLAEEAIIIGNLNCDEFAMGSTNENSAYGKVLNAKDETRIPGGSSGGSAVAVQAGLCMVSLGSDTGGSVRQPADLCGIVGMKPGYGRISRYGLIAYASSFDQIGIFANNIPDIAHLLQVMAGPDEYDSTVSRKPVENYPALLQTDQKYRIAYLAEALDHPSLDPEIASSIKDLLEQLRQKGHQVEPVAFDLIDHIVPAYYVLTTAEASSNLSRFDGIKYGYRSTEKGIDLTELYKQSRSTGFGREVKRRIMLGTFVLSAGYYDAYFTRAQKVRKLLSDQTQLIFKDFDIILLPTTPSVAFRIGEKMDDPIAMYLADIYTVMANLVGIPAISLPLFTHSTGMPFGLQAMTNRFDELSLLRFSEQVMRR